MNLLRTSCYLLLHAGLLGRNHPGLKKEATKQQETRCLFYIVAQFGFSILLGWLLDRSPHQQPASKSKVAELSLKCPGIAGVSAMKWTGRFPRGGFCVGKFIVKCIISPISITDLMLRS